MDITTILNRLQKMVDYWDTDNAIDFAYYAVEEIEELIDDIVYEENASE